MPNNSLTPPQFSLRALFGAVLACAVGLGILGWIDRVLPGSFASVACFVGGVAFGMFLAAVPWFYMQTRAARLGGVPLVRLRAPRWRMTSIWAGLAKLLFMLLTAGCTVVPAPGGDGSVWTTAILFFGMGSFLGLFVLGAKMTDVGPYLHERGFLVDIQFYPWKDVVNYRWQAREELILTVQFRHFRVGIPVVPEHRAAIEAVFAARVPGQTAPGDERSG